MTKKVKALFISDVHLGSRGSNADDLLAVLEKYNPQTLYIVGDFIDNWLLSKRYYWPQSHANIISKVLSLASQGCNVVYITGNHDEFLRCYKTDLTDGVLITDEIVVDGHLIIHGDLFDRIVISSPLVSHIGSLAADAITILNKLINKFKREKRANRSHIINWMKIKGLRAYLFISGFEHNIVKYAKSKGCHTVVCGHIHILEDKRVNEIRYINCGDWVDNNSYLVWDKDGIKVNTQI